MICTDIDKTSLDICQRRIPSAKCILVNAKNTTLPIRSISINLVLCIQVFPVIESNWFLSEAFRILKNEGLIVGVFLNKTSLRGLSVGTYQRLMSKYVYKHYQFSHYSFRKRLLCSGFEILYESGFCWFPFSRGSNSIFISLFTRLGRLLNPSVA